MRNLTMVGRFLLLGAVVTGCVRAVVPAPMPRDVTLGSLKAPVRDYAGAKVSPCAVDPAILAGDITAMNALLESFLRQTAAGAGGAWSKDQVKMLEEGQRVLPAALDLQNATLAGVAACKFPDKYALADLVAKGTELSVSVRKRLVVSPASAAEEHPRTALEDWKEKERAAQETERKSWCPPRPKPLPDVFYAWEDETGRIEWLFCDGSKVVVAAPGAEPEHVPAPEGPRRGKSIQTPSGYVKAAKRFPDSEIRRPPQGD